MRTQYGYADNNPANYIDPSGLSIFPTGVAGTIITQRLLRTYCAALSRLVERFGIKNPTDARAWRHFTGGSGRDLWISLQEMRQIMAASPNFTSLVSIAAEECETLGTSTVQTTTLVVEQSLPVPWTVALGRIAIKVTFTCECSCLNVQARINDRFDFDPRYLGERELFNEVKTRAVWLAQRIGDLGKCGWKEFNFKGLYIDEMGSGC
jgi:hypothetical protein